MNVSRRGFLKALGVGAGAMVGSRIPGSSLFGVARAATPEPTSVVTVYLNGGINAIFTGADAFMNTAFGVTGSNVTDLGGGVVIDNTLANAIPEPIRNRVASVGIRHGISGHGQARRENFLSGKDAAPLVLASAIGGIGAIKAATVGGTTLAGERPLPVNGVSLQAVTDMRATIEMIAGASAAANVSDRAGALAGIKAAQAMSAPGFVKHKQSLASVEEGFAAAVDTLGRPAQTLDIAEFNAAYGITGSAVNGFAAQMAAAELMVRSGTNYVFATEGGWDSHGDIDGTRVRNRMATNIAPALRTFLTRMVQNGAGRNVIVTIFGDFHRSLPGSDHKANLAALVIGKTLKNATTGRTDDRVGLAPGTPGIAGFWQLLAAAAKVDSSPFGANPHAALLA